MKVEIDIIIIKLGIGEKTYNITYTFKYSDPEYIGTDLLPNQRNIKTLKEWKVK